MREILFRGKDKYNGEWIEGYYYLSRSKYAGDKSFVSEVHTITTGIREVSGAYGEHSETIKSSVIPETVGQYTGLTDKNGTKIFEGDILKFSYNENDKEPKFYSVEWKKDRACFGYAETADKMIEVDCLHCEVIGNIHDNPELLKVGD